MQIAQQISKSVLNTCNNTISVSTLIFIYAISHKCSFSLNMSYHEFLFQLRTSCCSSRISSSLFFQLLFKCRKLRRFLCYLELSKGKKKKKKNPKKQTLKYCWLIQVFSWTVLQEILFQLLLFLTKFQPSSIYFHMLQ